MNLLSPSKPRSLSQVILLAIFLLLRATGSYLEGRPSPPKSQWLVEAGWLNEHLKDRVIVADTRTEQQYMQGHIPGAVWVDISGLGARTSESALPQLHQELAAKFSTLGITGAEQVVFYDESMGVKAPKALWFLSYAGYRWGRVLHGGFGAWQKAGFPVSTEKTVRPAKTFNVNANPCNPRVDRLCRQTHSQFDCSHSRCPQPRGVCRERNIAALCPQWAHPWGSLAGMDPTPGESPELPPGC